MDPSLQTEYQSLTPLESTPPSPTTGIISPNALTFAATILPLTIFALITTITIHKAVTKQNKKLSEVFLGLKMALIVSSLPIGVSLLLSQTNLVIKAEKDNTPRNIRIVDITPTSATLKWRTGSKSIGGYRLSQTANTSIPLQTIINLNTPTLTHQFTIDTLTPNTTYYLQLYSETAWYDNAGVPITFTTTTP